MEWNLSWNLLRPGISCGDNLDNNIHYFKLAVVVKCLKIYLSSILTEKVKDFRFDPISLSTYELGEVSSCRPRNSLVRPVCPCSA